MRTRRLQQQLTDLWTVEEVARKFGVTTMTIHNWRNDKGLPSIVIPGTDRPAVRFVPDDVRKWAREQKIWMGR